MGVSPGAEPRRTPPFSSLTTYISVPELVRNGACDALARGRAEGAVYYSGDGEAAEDIYVEKGAGKL
jgi:hypothetical protein